ncbi:MAG: NUDIX hydrolase [Candidatus Paceibacterota bacterium]
MIHENTYKKVDFNGAKGLVFIGDKILVYRRDDKTKKSPLCIDMPGGGHEGDETPFETFKREVKEEFGIEINKDDIVFCSPFQSFDDPNKISFFLVTKPLNFKESDIKFGDEGTEWLLMTPDEFIKRPDGIERQQKRVVEYLSKGVILK